jgi:hypothetical protein
VAETTDPLRAALARLAEAQGNLAIELARPLLTANLGEIATAANELTKAARDLPAADLLARLERLEAACRAALAELLDEDHCHDCECSACVAVVPGLRAALAGEPAEGDAGGGGIEA